MEASRGTFLAFRERPFGPKTPYFMGLRLFVLSIAFHALTLQNMNKGSMKGGPICHHAQKN
jgi:hypothetical protein